jgi:hypothetical protein
MKPPLNSPREVKKSTFLSYFSPPTGEMSRFSGTEGFKCETEYLKEEVPL